MSISAIITLGYGSFGSVPDVIRMGYGAQAAAPVVAAAAQAGGDSKRKHKRRTLHTRYWSDEPKVPEIYVAPPKPAATAAQVVLEAVKQIQVEPRLSSALHDMQKKRRRLMTIAAAVVAIMDDDA